jgi:hypothetical protein
VAECLGERVREVENVEEIIEQAKIDAGKAIEKCKNYNTSRLHVNVIASLKPGRQLFTTEL